MSKTKIEQYIDFARLSRFWGHAKAWIERRLAGKQDAISDLDTIRGGAALGATAMQSYTETDPTVPAWAKEATKPAYTASEVGALPASTHIPSKTSELTNDSGFLTSHQDISGKEDRTAVVAAVNEEDATLAVTALATDAGRYYRLDVAVGGLAVTLPAMTDTSVVRTVVLFLTAGTAPAVTFTAADGRAVYYADGFEIEAGGTYEVNALFNGAAWVIACVTIVTE